MSGASVSLPSSQTQVFVGEKGKSWRFFVEATAVRQRPALIRKIIKNGGSVVNTAREADIVLAEHNSKEALELFEAWHQHKVLLSTRWVARCLEAQAFLGRDHGWAGCEFTREVLLQGIVASDEEADEVVDEKAEEEEVSLRPKRPRRIVTSSQASNAPPSQSCSEPGLNSSSTASPSQSRKLSSRTEQIIEQKPPNLSTDTHHSPSQSSGNSSLHTPQHLSLPVNTPLPAPLSSIQTTLEQQQQQRTLLATMFNSLIQPSLQPSSPDISNPLGQFTNFPQNLPLLAPSIQQFLSQHLAVNPFVLNSHPTERTDRPGLGSTGQQLPSVGYPSGSNEEYYTSTRPTPEDVDKGLVSDIASVTSEEGEVEHTISRRRTGKGRAISDSSSDFEVQTAVRSIPPRSKGHVPSKLSGLFVDWQGKPRNFFVVVDIKNRKNLLKIIRKHKGVIVPKMQDADYIILNTRSNHFQTVLGSLPKQKIALSPTWLEECENKGAMAEIKPYILDASSGIRQGAARQKPISAKIPSSIPEECESEEETSARTAMPSKLLPTSNIEDGNISTPRARSLSPLPPTNITPTFQGKYLFTEEDRIWFLKYARFKLERNHYMTNGALMRAIAHKAPHHTANSWSQAARSKWSAELEALKREVTLCTQVNKAEPLPSSPITPSGSQNELMYPETSPTRLPNQPSLNLPFSSASTSRSSQTESICTTPLKRKEQPHEDEFGMVVKHEPNKKLKTPVDMIDVDPLYMDHRWDLPTPF